jgi:Lambda phage tail tube protein, TTP
MGGLTSYGVVFKMGTTSTPSTTIADVLEVGPPKTSRDAVDVTTHGSPSGAMEAIPDGIYDPGEVTVQMLYTAASASDSAILTAFSAGTLYYFQWTAKGASGTKTFTTQGVIIEYGPDPLPVKGKQSASMKIKLSGPVTVA